MEYLVFLIVAVGAAVLLYRRGRPGGSSAGPGNEREGTADYDLAYTRGYGMKQEPLNTRIPRQERISRDAGHGKDGGG